MLDKEREEDDSLLTNHFQVRDYLVMLFLDFIFLGVRFKVFDSFWGSVVDHKGGLALASLRSRQFRTGIGAI